MINDQYESLTTDARYLLLQMVKSYLDRRSSGASKFQATTFGDCDQIHADIMPEWNSDDVSFTLGELSRKDFIVTGYGSNKITSVTLTTDAIAWQEQKFGNDVKKIAGAIAGVVKLIHFL